MAVPQSSIDLLADYFKSPPKGLTPDTADIAKFILLNSSNKLDPKPKKKSSSGPISLMGRIFDVLSRPNYAVANTFLAGIKGEDMSDAFFEGLAGKDKTTFSDVIREDARRQGKDVSNLEAGFGGLLGDIVLDPTTYIGVGLIGKAGRLGKAAIPEARQAVRAQEIPEAFAKVPEKAPEVKQIPRPSLQAPKPEFPRITVPGAAQARERVTALTAETPKFEQTALFPGRAAETPEAVIPPVAKTVVPKGQIPFRFDRTLAQLGQPAHKIVDDVALGDAQAQLRIMPKPSPVAASQKLDRQIQNAANKVVERWKQPAGKTELYPSQIKRLYHDSVNQVLKTVGRKRLKGQEGFAVFKVVEELLEQKGLYAYNGVRLSDVAAELPKMPIDEVVENFAKVGGLPLTHPVRQAVESVKARAAITDAPIVKEAVNEASHVSVAARSVGAMSETQIKDFEKHFRKIKKKQLETKGAAFTSVDAADRLMKTVFAANTTPVQRALESKLSVVDDMFKDGVLKNPGEVNAAMTNGLVKVLGPKPPRDAMVHNNKAVEWFMGRYTTWWGQKELRPLALNAIAGARVAAQARGKALDVLFAPYSKEQARQAYYAAVHGLDSASPEIRELAMNVNRIMENFFSPKGMNSVLKRSQVSQKEINKHLMRVKAGLQLSKHSKNRITGAVDDYSEGLEWMNSWKSFTPHEDVKHYLFKVGQAMDAATREKAWYDELGERFGSRIAGKGYTQRIEHPYLNGYYFEPEIASQAQRAIKTFDEVFDSGSSITQFYDKILSAWKSGVTIYAPSHHIRNLIGDSWMSWMDGVVSPRPYYLAGKILRSQRNRYNDIADVQRLVDVGALPRQIYNTPKPNEIIFRNKAGVGFTSEQIYTVAHQKGLLLHANTIEDIIDEAGLFARHQPLGGRGQRAARGVAEVREHYVRMAHFIHLVQKSKTKNLDDAFEQAARRVRKWHPDGLDLTDFEKRTMRRLIPFYSWNRKALPLVLEGLALNPGKVVAVPKLFDALQESQGIETPGRHDPFPIDQMFPNWLREKGVGPIGLPGGLLGGLAHDQPPGYAMLNPSTPLQDLIGEYGGYGSPTDTLRGIGGSLSPFLRVPGELISEQKWFSGAPIQRQGQGTSESYLEYAGEQIPIFSLFQRMSGLGAGGVTATAEKQGLLDEQAIINYLTAAGLRGTGPYIKQAQFEAKERARRGY